MAGAQITIMANQVEGQRLGYQAISLTHFADTLEPQLCAGSKVEIGSALFEFAALESITGWGGIANSSTVYIKLTVAGASVTASFTTTAPTWSDSKQGWYNALERYIGGLYKDAGGNYTLKWFYRASSGGIQAVKEYGDGTVLIPDNTVTSAKIDKTMTSGSQAVNAGATWTIPAGIYSMVYNRAVAQLEIIIDGVQSNLAWAGGAIVSDGTNVQLKNTAGANTTVYYRKLA